MAETWMTKFENALGDLVEQYLRDGMSGSDVQRVLRARADDDYVALEVEVQKEASAILSQATGEG